MQISIGFCTHFIGIGLLLGLGVEKCKCAITGVVVDRSCWRGERYRTMRLLQTFGPLLQKYFTYEELKELRSKVIDKHFEKKDDQVEDILAAEELEKWALEQQIKESSTSK